jgi:hypothetical protein
MNSADIWSYVQELVLVHQMLYGIVIFFAKASLFLLYLRLFSPDRCTRNLIYFGLVVTFLVYLGTTVATGAFCIPRPGESWFGAVISLRCSKGLFMAFVQGIFNVISDFYILVIPVPVVLKLQLPLRKKIGVCAIVMTGLL